MERFRHEFHALLYQEQDALYFGYYLHLIQDLIFRRLMYEDYHWNPVPDGNVLRLHNSIWMPMNGCGSVYKRYATMRKMRV